jgi:hypothetical protein
MFFPPFFPSFFSPFFPPFSTYIYSLRKKQSGSIAPALFFPRFLKICSYKFVMQLQQRQNIPMLFLL